MRTSTVAVALLLATAGCSVRGGGGGGGSGDPSRPDDCDDVNLFVVSGHTLGDGSCDSGAAYNCEYLDDRGTVAALADVWRDRGDTVFAPVYTDNLHSWGVDGNDNGEIDYFEIFAFGFLDLLYDIELFYSVCSEGYSNPSKTVLAAHSHGTVWAHSAAMLLDHIEFDYLVDLDANTLCWESDLACGFLGDSWRSEVGDYQAENAPGWWFDVGEAADSWPVEGFSTLFDIEDIAPPNVRFNVEVRSSSSVAYDNSDNYRLDGTRDGILSASFQASHTEVTEPGEPSFEWVVEQLRGLP